ncbi:hypothetical protein B0H66DRAFT_622803 [Apodospora peruviana]|uniref:Rhodanese domain-containing protein n=1 Tax=Apodospora peruviana TaxID=516989 RepID=A0AAE0I599_9PEZI|nr:hypothetical protein B0H66DRAFT_622803 [Apodospora peruviana]
MSQPRNIIIVGGVAGGMSCATRLRRLDEKANITVIEKGPFISYANCGLPYALGGVIQDESKLNVQTVEKIQSWFNVHVRVNSELMSVDRASKTVTIRDESGATTTLPYHKLVLAMGAKPLLPKITGIDTTRVFHLHTIPDLRELENFIRTNNCKKAAVVGGGFIGVEAVENLKMLGLDVTLVEYNPHIFPPMDGDLAEILHEEMRKNGVKLLLNATLTKIVPAAGHSCSLYFEKDDPDNHPVVTIDVAVLAVGIRPRTTVVAAAGIETGSYGGIKVNEYLQTVSDPDIYAAGDMVETPNLVAGKDMITALAGPANRQGRLVADNICGRHVRYRGNVGAAICKVFGKTLGLCGFSVESLPKFMPEVKFKYITVHPPNHAGYYPGAANMTIRLAFEVPGGRILGAQIVGQEGVDKRIDVMATAMRAGMNVEDLEHLELAYSPPYNSAKDPVNMAGFVAGNVLRGDVEVAHAAEFAEGGPRKLEEYQIVDVRSVPEFERGHLVNGENVPLGNLREHIKKLDRRSKTLVLCQVGYRGYLAYRILKQSGFDDVSNLDGGFKSVLEGPYDALQAKV